MRGADPDLVAAGELDRTLNLMLVRMARSPLFEWVMAALQMGFSSHDHALYENPAYRERVAANWRETVQAIVVSEPMRALSCIGQHYSLLRECITQQHEPVLQAALALNSASGDRPEGRSS